MRHLKNKSLIYITLFAVVMLFVSLATKLPNVSANNDEDSSVFVSDGSYHVAIYDENKKTIIKTDAKTVAEVLERANIKLGEYDSVEPGKDTEINADNFFINIHRARPALVVDGLARKLVMTASYDPKTIAEEAGFTVYDGDQVSINENNQFLELGIASVYKITRGEGATITVEEEIPFAEQSEKDYSLGAGKTEVVQLGEVGSKTLVYSVKTKNGIETSRELISETVTREPVARITRVGADPIEMNPLTVSKGRNRYTFTKDDGTVVERQETYYDLNMSNVMAFCGQSSYSVREDGVKIDPEGYILVAANLSRYPRCSVVQTSLGLGKVYDTGGFAVTNPEQFDIATDWTNRDGR